MVEDAASILTIPEFHAALGGRVGLKAIREFVKQGRIWSLRVGRRTLIPAAEVYDWPRRETEQLHAQGPVYHSGGFRWSVRTVPLGASVPPAGQGAHGVASRPLGDIELLPLSAEAAAPGALGQS